MLSNDDFIQVLKLTPLVSIDLIVFDTSGRVLVGKRINNPAKGFWFVPGGRIFKDERIENAFQRLAFTELGLDLGVQAAEFAGVYQHFYQDNKFDLPGISTHYVVLAYLLKLEDSRLDFPTEQHREYRWMAVEELVNSDTVHQNTKDYFLKPNPVIQRRVEAFL